ncbi:MAG: zinc ABC transporter substrate-binding protein [Acidobacteriales bacterium]|nr:zinc ABC transporter substrate-binding protein [Terriglobales bacterium]
MNSVVPKYGLLLAAAAVLAASLISPATTAAKKLNVVTATTDLAALAQEVGGDRISVEAIAKGYQDPHYVEAKPSFLLKLRQADLLVVCNWKSGGCRR